MTELLSLPDLPADQVGSAQILAAAAGAGGTVAYKVALASYLTSSGAAQTYAPLTSPSLRGVPTAPTPVAGTNTTQIATTAFVTGMIAGFTALAPTVTPPATPAVLQGDDVKRALGFVPYDALNPSGYATTSSVTATVSTALAGVPAYSLPVASGSVLGGVRQGAGVTIAGDGMLSVPPSLASFQGRSAASAILVTADVTGVLAAGLPVAQGGTGATVAAGALVALGAYAAANPAEYQTAANMMAMLGGYLTSASATSTYQPLLGFVPYSSANPSAYQTAGQVMAALSGYATTNYVDGRITALINAAPAALDTLGEIATQLAADESAAAALTTAVAGKLSTTAAATTYLTIVGAAALYQPALGFTAYNAANPAGYQTAPNVTAMFGAYLTSAGAAAAYQPLLGFTPYNATNPAGYITSAGAPVQSVAGRMGAVALTVGDVSGAYASSNPAGYQTGAQVSAALSGYATTSYVDGRVTALINAAPAALDTLGEIATQLASDESAAAALTTSVAAKLAKTANLSDLASVAAARTNLGLAAVAASGAYADLSGAPVSYSLPSASTSVLGGVKVDGSTVTINGSGVISVLAGGSSTIPVTTVAASGASQTLTAPTSGAKAYDLTLSANCALSLSGGTAGQQQMITVYLRQDATAGRVVTLPTGVRWPGGTAPRPNTAAGVIDVFTFITPDAGTTWFGGY